MMPSRHSLRLAVGAAILALGIGACAGCTPSPTARGEVPPTLPPQSATPEPTASPSPTPTVASPSTPKPTPVSADPVAQDVYRYYRVLDELRQKPPRDPYKKLFAITRGEAFDMWQDVLVQQSFSGEHSTGFVKVNLTDRGKVTSKDGSQRIQVGACVDLSGIDYLDKNGKSIMAKGEPARTEEKLWLIKEKKSWYVMKSRDGAAKC